MKTKAAIAWEAGKPLTIEEVEKIEAGHRFEKGYRDRVARALGLPEGIFEEISDIPDAA